MSCSVGPPSFTNSQHHGFSAGVTQMATVTSNSFAGDLVQSSHNKPPHVPGSPLAGQPPGLVQGIPPGPASQNGLPSADLCYNGTELVVLYDYKVRDGY